MGRVRCVLIVERGLVLDRGEAVVRAGLNHLVVRGGLALPTCEDVVATRVLRRRLRLVR